MTSTCVMAESGSGSISSNTSSACEYPLCQGDEADHAGSSGQIRSDSNAGILSLVRALKYSASNLAAASPEILGARVPNIAISGASSPSQNRSGNSTGRPSSCIAFLNVLVNDSGSELESRYHDSAVSPAGRRRTSLHCLVSSLPHSDTRTSSCAKNQSHRAAHRVSATLFTDRRAPWTKSSTHERCGISARLESCHLARNLDFGSFHALKKWHPGAGEFSPLGSDAERMASGPFLPAGKAVDVIPGTLQHCQICRPGGHQRATDPPIRPPWRKP